MFMDFYTEKNLVSKANIEKLIDEILSLFFIGYYETFSNLSEFIEEKKRNIIQILEIEVKKVSNDLKILDEFIQKLYLIRKQINLDIACYIEKDPSINYIDEVILSSQGLYATILYRISHLIHSYKIKLIPKIISFISYTKTGIDINPSCYIGNSFFIDHGSGVVIGETAIIGNNVSIYQGVTLGALNLNNPITLKNTKRHPTIEDNCTIYANATILGGNTIIKKNSIIGSCAFITKTVEENSYIKRSDFNDSKKL